MQATNGYILGNFCRGPRWPLVVVVTDQFERKSTGVLEADEGLTKTLLNGAVLHLEGVEAFQPEVKGSCRHSIRRDFHLASAFTPINTELLIGKARHDRA